MVSTSAIKAQQPTVYGIVMAGGVGERLWPLSRKDNPKQFLKLGSSKSLLEQSIDRLRSVVSPGAISVLTASSQVLHVKRVCDSSVGIISEPVGRNTGPAMLYACLELYEKDPNAVAMFVPADPFIPEHDTMLFQYYTKAALDCASVHDRIVLLGVKPTHATTGYGYIEYDDQTVEKGIHRVFRFHEKPSIKLAEQYYKQPTMLWNIGMFAGKVSVFIDEFKRLVPELFEKMQQYKAGNIAYSDLESISVDYAIIEKSNRVWVQPVDFSWCDVGNVQVFLSIKEKYETQDQTYIAVDSHNNLVDVPNKIVALVGVSDLCIVETADALLITHKSDAEKVRSVVAQLKQDKTSQYT